MTSNILSSIYDPGFYATMRERRTSAAVGHLCVISFLAALIYTGMLYTSFVSFRDMVAQAPEKIVSMYPENLVFSVDHGVGSVMGVEEPVIIPIAEMPTAVPEGTTVNDFKASDVVGKNIVIDTITPFSITALKEKNAFAWIGKDGVYSVNDKGEIKGFEYGKETTFTVSKTKISEISQWVAPLMVYVLPILIACAFVFTFFGIWIWYSIVALLLAIIVKLYYRFILKNAIFYSHAYRTTSFALTAPLFTKIALTFTGITIPYFLTLSTLAIVILNTYAHGKSSEPQQPTLVGVS